MNAVISTIIVNYNAGESLHSCAPMKLDRLAILKTRKLENA